MRIVVVIAALMSASAACAADLPDKRLTKGAVSDAVTKAELCTRNYVTAHHLRDVKQSVKRQVYRRYGMTANKAPCPCEVDHLISLEIGGSNAIANLWPQPYRGRLWNAHVKDGLENRLHALVCRGVIPLKAAQTCIRDNWTACYRKYFKIPRRGDRHAARPAP